MRQIWLILAFMPIIWSSCVGVDDSEWTKHHTNAEVKSILDDVHRKCPQRTRVYSLPNPEHTGVPHETVNGSTLWVIEFSPVKPGHHEQGIPEFKYIGNMHGNEVVGKEILLRLAVFLCDQMHNEDLEEMVSKRFSRSDILTLLANTRIHIMPSMNPDGWAIANEVDQSSQEAWLAGRANGNAVDLNRNFPDLDMKYYLTENLPNHHNNHLERLDTMLNDAMLKLESETKMVMAWIFSQPWVLSANMHGGDLVANYPFDEEKPGQRPNTIAVSPDHELFKQLALSYSMAHRVMATDHPSCDKDNSAEDEGFVKQGGITNGAQWYSVPGGMQDFNYFSSNCYEITLELGCVKFPPGNQLEKLWFDNFDAMINYMFMSHIGIKGGIFVEEEDEHIPVVIQVSVYDKETMTETKIDHDILSTKYGDYFRLLIDGTYTVKAILQDDEKRTISKCVTVKNDNLSGAKIVNFDFRDDTYSPGETCAEKNQEVQELMAQIYNEEEYGYGNDDSENELAYMNFLQKILKGQKPGYKLNVPQQGYYSGGLKFGNYFGKQKNGGRYYQ